MANDIKPPISGYSIWFMASGNDHTKLQDLIEDLSKSAGSRRFDAHATLIGLLDFTSESKELLTKGTQQLASQSAPIAAELTGVGMRNAHFQSVFLHVVPNQQLVQLSQAARQLFSHEADPPFMPHVSMAYGDFEWQIKQGLQQQITAKVSFPLTITFDRLALVRVDGYPDEWVIESESPFRK